MIRRLLALFAKAGEVAALRDARIADAATIERLRATLDLRTVQRNAGACLVEQLRHEIEVECSLSRGMGAELAATKHDLDELRNACQHTHVNATSVQTCPVCAVLARLNHPSSRSTQQ